MRSSTVENNPLQVNLESAYICVEDNELKTAFQFTKNALILARKLPHGEDRKKVMMAIFSIAGTIYFKNKQFTDAIKYYEKTVQHLATSNLPPLHIIKQISIFEKGIADAKELKAKVDQGEAFDFAVKDTAMINFGRP